MELFANLNVFELITNLQHFMEQAIAQYHSWVYLILFAVLFCETGLVVTPFLPGDSLLFIAGSFTVAAAQGEPPLELARLIPILCLAPVLGDTVNYWIGRYVGPKIFHKENVRFLNKEHLDRAHAFYERHGGKAVAIGRFLPIIRTFVPFVAGIGKMAYPRFLAFSVTGTLAWINLCVLAGHFFGNLPFVRKHFELVIVAIIVISLIPAVVGFLQTRRAAKKPSVQPQQAPADARKDT